LLNAHADASLKEEGLRLMMVLHLPPSLVWRARISDVELREFGLRDFFSQRDNF
jgi:hypothetical protein